MAENDEIIEGEGAVEVVGGLIKVEASKKVGDVEKKIEVVFDFGSDMADAAAKYGEKVIFSNYVRAAKITLQAILRRGLVAGKSEDELKNIAASWKPGVALERSFDPMAALINKMKDMSEEEQQETLKKLMASLQQ